MIVPSLPQFILKKYAGRFIVRCNRCKGMAGFRFIKRCELCDERRWVVLSIPAGTKVEQIGVYRCMRCRGIGKTETETHCRVCGGLGLLLGSAPRVTCMCCRGTGRHPAKHSCSTCLGWGSIEWTVHNKRKAKSDD